MISNLHLAAIVNRGDQIQLLHIPLHQGLQNRLSVGFRAQYEAFTRGVEEVDFDPAYKPDVNERFRIQAYDLPEWIAQETSLTISELRSLGEDGEEVEHIVGIAIFARDEGGEELLFFQNFNRGHVIRPGRFLLLQNDVYGTAENPGLVLGTGLSAVFKRPGRKLLFRNFRNANTYLPLAKFYSEASEEEIREVLGSDLFHPEDVDALAVNANQWFRKRFAMLNDSGILDAYTADQIADLSEGYELEITVEAGRIVFPKEKREAKRLLQFLNEEIFRGAITDTLYETNSKREAD